MVGGGNFPLAYVYPKEMRGTRDLLRRRTFFVRRRAELLAHVQNTFTQYNIRVSSGWGRDRLREDNPTAPFADESVKFMLRADIGVIDPRNRRGQSVRRKDDETAGQGASGWALSRQDRPRCVLDDETETAIRRGAVLEELFAAFAANSRETPAATACNRDRLIQTFFAMVRRRVGRFIAGTPGRAPR